MISVSSAARRGFTLIELLVVIAIIGILSSVVLASLNTARNKGADASVKSNLGEARAQAELFYDANGNKYYSASGAGDVCNTAGLQGGVKGIYASVAAAATATGATVVQIGTAADATHAACHADTTGAAWAAQAPLKAASGSYYCVDSTGNAVTSTTALATNAVVCS